MRPFLLALCLTMAAISAPATAHEVIARVWAGHSVGFGLTSSETHIYAGYYDAERRLTVASRPKTGGPWTYQKLDTHVEWDSHNYITLAFDAQGRLHVAANMHAVPLIYFMSEPGGDVATLKRFATLVDPKTEQSMTYPIFLHDPQGRLILKYRDGGSSRGNEIYNVFDAATWSRLTAAPLVNGEGIRNAYFMGPKLGADGLFHIVWVWRDSPDAATNHDLSYAKSRDLVTWQTSDGRPLPLPITFAAAEIVDPVPVRGGMINNNTLIGFDDQGRVMITYHKYDDKGDTQIWVARREADGWRRVQVSQWRSYRWDFGGTGSLNTEIFVYGVEPAGDGLLRVPVVRLGQSIDFLIRSDDLSLVEERPVQSLADRLKDEMTVPTGMMLNVMEADGYALAWATNPPNRDRPYPVIPPATELFLVTKQAH